MNVIKRKFFGKVEAIQLGFGPFGPPLMSVYLYHIDGLLIDSGQRNMRKAAVDLLAQRKIERILLTHHHEDHSGNAAVLARSHRAAVIAHPATVEKMRCGFRILPYQHYIWGKADVLAASPYDSTIESYHFKLKPIHTPGHSKDHTVYLEEGNGWLFSGDLYLADRIKYFRSDERLHDQINSLKKVLEFDFEALFCAHNPWQENGRSKLINKLQFLEDLNGHIHRLKDMGYSERDIVKSMDNQTDRLVKWITMGNVSFANMIRSALNTDSRSQVRA